MTDKPRFVMCICTGQCPGFEQLNVWELINYVRGELDVEYAIVHPQLCVEDGDNFWKDYAKKGVNYIVGACDPFMQKKMYKEAIASVGVDFDTQIKPLDLRNHTTAEAIEIVTKAVQGQPAATK
jgi:heterodisulfide reductase subunit A-like polyferredoxin